MEHILLQDAFKYLKAEPLNVPGFEYKILLGAWVECNSSQFLVNHKDFPVRGTKKYDVETGEDAKGQ